ncbi:hypothetical protein EGW08_011667, partial [Elysia chlorotica]
MNNSSNNKTGHLPRNHENILEDCAGSSNNNSGNLTPSEQGQNQPTTDLPVNEARRRGSSADLPANMRPGRQQKSDSSGSGTGSGSVGVAAGGGGDGAGQDEDDGDFDVYNIESAVPGLSWEQVEKHIQDRMRRESCKNDREEIRRRLAMATDEEFGDDVTSGLSSSAAAESQPLMMSPRNKRLQV